MYTGRVWPRTGAQAVPARTEDQIQAVGEQVRWAGPPQTATAEALIWFSTSEFCSRKPMEASVAKTKCFLPEDNVAQILSFHVCFPVTTLLLGSHQLMELWAGRNLNKVVLSLSLSHNQCNPSITFARTGLSASVSNLPGVRNRHSHFLKKKLELSRWLPRPYNHFRAT